MRKGTTRFLIFGIDSFNNFELFVKIIVSSALILIPFKLILDADSSSYNINLSRFISSELLFVRVKANSELSQEKLA